MPYIPHSDADRDAMFGVVGIQSLDELFSDIPKSVRFPDLDLPPAASELEVRRELEGLASSNLTAEGMPCFLGAGAAHHFVPAVVDAVISRGEFATSYTPYQPEISQGTLEAAFEYQTMICALTGMEVSNASHYDGATSTAEAVITAVSLHRGKRHKVVLSPFVHPEYREVVRTYTQGMGLRVVGDGKGDPQRLQDLVDGDTTCVVVQYPNFLGQIADFSSLAEVVHRAGAYVVVVADPIALGLLKPPGQFGADIVVGDGQGLGLGLNFGGPYLGFFATRKEYVRKMAGRLVGQTVDAGGARGFVLTLSTREQHIRRGRATSNICSNQSLMTLAAAVYMAAMGPSGLRQVAEICYHRAHYAASRINQLKGYEVESDRPFFNEFVVHCPLPVDDLNRILLEEWGILGGYDMGWDDPDSEYDMLVAVTEMVSKEDIDRLVDAFDDAAEEVDW